MRAVIQRVSKSAVRIDGAVVAETGAGLLVLLGVEEEDDAGDIEWLVPKIARMRIFPDAAGKMNLCLAEAGGGMTVVSQFTLHASTRKGNRPSFVRAARPEKAEPLYEAFCDVMSAELGRPVGRGVFAAEMTVELANDGPVTILMDSRARE